MSTFSSPSGGGFNGNILNECSDIDRGIDLVEQNLGQLRNLHRAALGDTDTSSNSRANREVDALSSDTMELYRSLVDRVRHVKSSPEAGQPMNARQVERIDRRLKTAIQQYQGVEADFQREMQGQIARQFRIVRPDATEEEVSRAVDGAEGGQVFTQALMQSNRQGQASAALNNVKDRHAQILKIEKQMSELAQLFQDMNTLVVQQEVAVQQIDQQAEDVVENLDKGNTEIDTAVTTARATRRKKWWCLGITGMSIPLSTVFWATRRLTIFYSPHHHHCCDYCRRIPGGYVSFPIFAPGLAYLANYYSVTGQLGGGGDKDDNDNEKRSVAGLEVIKAGLVETLPNARRHLSETAAILAPSAKFRRVLREAV